MSTKPKTKRYRVFDAATGATQVVDVPHAVARSEAKRLTAQAADEHARTAPAGVEAIEVLAPAVYDIEEIGA